MGKAYAEEIGILPETYGWAAAAPIGGLSRFVGRAAGIPLYVVGSGGSFAAAAFASHLHQRTGTMSRCITPLELLEFEDKNGATLLISAGGNNVDILAAFDHAARVPERLGVLCASADNALTRRASTHPEVMVHAAGPPSGRDGFLATNSLLATEIWLARAYASRFPDIGGLPAATSSIIHDGLPARKFGEMMSERMTPLRDRDTVLILHDGWGRAAAVDAETRLSEAGLAGTQLADYRNFAHGRYNWLDKNRDRTGIIAFVTPGCDRLAARTLCLIPEYAPVVTLRSVLDGPAASINLLVKSMHAARYFGEVRGIDPGRPHVAKFGRDLHHLAMPEDGSW